MNFGTIQFKLNFSREIAMVWIKTNSSYSFKSEGSKSWKLRKIQIMENQESCSTLVENQIKNGPDAGKDEQALVHTRSIGAKNEERVEENNLTYAEVWALRQRIFQENVEIWIIVSKIYTYESVE